MSVPSRALRERIIDLEVAENDVAHGRALRKTTPRKALGQLIPCPRSATEILVAQNANRLAELVPLRFARMLTDPVSFYRGSAAVMAADLATGPSSGIEVMCCGDAHMWNFGVYAAPDRALVFDLNDFDEAAAALWEWDIKRLITSAVIGGRHAGYQPKTIRALADRAVTVYQDALSEILGLNVLDRYYMRFQPEFYRKQMGTSLESVIERTLRRARKRICAQVFGRIMAGGADGASRPQENPPKLQHVELDAEGHLVESFREYLTAVSADIALLLSHFRVTDLALRVVGVGSVGTRCYLAILTGPEGTLLILQIKEANRSVLDEYGGVEQPRGLRNVIEAQGQGVRVVEGQRVLQAVSDVFLGAARTTAGTATCGSSTT